MWFLRIAEELSNVVPAISEELSNVVPASRRGAI